MVSDAIEDYLTYPQPVRSKPRKSRLEVADRIKDLIISRGLRPGDLLPTESELCQELDASRSSVREAIKTLSALDIVDVRHGHGTFVGSVSMAGLVEALAFRGLLSSEDDRKVLTDLVDVRELLETGFAPTFVRSTSPNYHDRLVALTDRMVARAAAGEEFFEEDRDFHMVLVEPLGNDLVTQLTGAFWDIHARVAAPRWASDQVLVDSAANHKAIVAAIAAGDIELVRQAIRIHYGPIRNRVAELTGRRRNT